MRCRGLHVGSHEASDDGPDFRLTLDGHWFPAKASRLEPPLTTPEGELADKHIAKDHSDDHLPGCWHRRGIGYQNVTGMDAAFAQGITTDAHGVAVRAAQIEDVREVYGTFDSIPGRADEPRRVRSIIGA